MSKIKSVVSVKEMKQINTFDSANAEHMAALQAMGINVALEGAGFDSTEPFISGGVSANISNLRNFLPGIVREITTVRKIDELLGMVTVGNWEDEEIVQMVQERTATAKPYADNVAIPYTSYNTDYERRTIVRFVIGMKSDLLADKRAAASGMDPIAAKTTAAATALEIARNEVGFYGYNDGANKTYGFLNDPNLPAYATLPNGAGGDPEWSTKTFQEKQADFVAAISALMTNTGGNFDPMTDSFTWAIPLSVASELTQINEYGISIAKWVRETYPKCRMVHVPELDAANGGANVFYLYADMMKGDSTDNGRVFDQLVAEKYMSIGRGQEVGGYKEGFTNAVAGALLKRPYAVYRASGM
jgi:hypothetical protein